MYLKKMLLVSSIILFVCCSKSNSESAQSLPVANSATANIVRPDITSSVKIKVDLSTNYTKDVSIQYATTDGTAKAGKDYTAASGTLTIPAGSSSGYIDVVIAGDSLRQSQQKFSVSLSNPVNCTLKSNTIDIYISNDGTYLPFDTTGYKSPDSYPGYILKWSDEFNTKDINATNWKFETGTGSNGWGNNELENYTSRSQNAFTSGGSLIIEARQETYNSSAYTSARMVSAGLQEFQFGHIDIRAKLPVAKGMWPAIWMLGSNISQAGWPKCGEMDIMELVGTYPSRVTSTLHWANAAGNDMLKGTNYSILNADFSQQFHVFSADWKQDTIAFSVDGNLFLTVTNNDIAPLNNPFNSPFFFILNVAVGGNWPGPPDGTTVFPQRMYVDYVRVFAKQ